MAQLKKERQKQQNIEEDDNPKDHSRPDEDDFQATVTRIPRTYTSVSTKKAALSTTAISVSTKQQMTTTTTTLKAAGIYDSNDDFQPVVTRVGTTATAQQSSKKHTSSMRKDVLSTAHKTTNLDEYNPDDSQHTHITRIPRQDSSKSMKNSFLNLHGNFPSGSLSRKALNITCDTPLSHNDIDINSSHNSSNPYATSTTNILRKSDVVDQEFRLDDGKEHARRNDTKSHGSINISGREK